MLVDARQVRRRRDPRLLLRAQARRSPSAPAACASSRSRASRSSRPAARPRSRTAWSCTRRPSACRPPSRRWSSSCSSTTRSTARSATRAASARCRTSPSAGAAGISRFIEPKRHFEKPLALSPLVAIDRERCILCYRCVRFSPGDRRGLPARPARARRAHLRRHVRRAPLRGAVQRQHRRALPGRRADLAALPLPRAPVGHRGGGLGLHALPGAVQRHLHRPRRRASCACSARDNAEVDDGWLCDKGRFAYQAVHVDERDHAAAAARRRRAAPGLAGSARSTRRAAALDRAGGARRRPGRRRGHQRGGLPPAAPAARGPRLDRPRLAPDGALALDLHARAARARRCRRRSPTSSSPTPCWCSTPSPSTTRRSSTCACARASAATA